MKKFEGFLERERAVENWYEIFGKSFAAEDCRDDRLSRFLSVEENAP